MYLSDRTVQSIGQQRRKRMLDLGFDKHYLNLQKNNSVYYHFVAAVGHENDMETCWLACLWVWNGKARWWGRLIMWVGVDVCLCVCVCVCVCVSKGRGGWSLKSIMTLFPDVDSSDVITEMNNLCVCLRVYERVTNIMTWGVEAWCWNVPAVRRTQEKQPH